MNLLISNKEEILKYGLDYTYGTMKYSHKKSYKFHDIIERGVAKYYVLMYDLTQIPEWHWTYERKRTEYVEHTLKLSHFFIDYLLILCMGEARHFSIHPNQKSTCQCAKFTCPGYSHSRIRGAKKNILRFTSYDEALKQLCCCFNRHYWSASYGGYKWGNIAYATHMLYKAVQARDINSISQWLDILCSLEHNGGSVFKDKFKILHTNTGVLGDILNHKFNGDKLCLEWLRYYAGFIKNKPTDWCTHYKEYSKEMVLDPNSRVCPHHFRIHSEWDICFLPEKPPQQKAKVEPVVKKSKNAAISNTYEWLNSALTTTATAW